jgi:hypothetical protein
MIFIQGDIYVSCFALHHADMVTVSTDTSTNLTAKQHCDLSSDK